MFIKDKFWILWLKCYSFSQCGFAQVSSVQLLSPVRLFVTSWTAACQASLAITNRACSYSWPLSQWHHPTISSSVTPFSSCLQSLPTSGSFQMSQLFTSGSQNIGVSASISVLPINTQDWSPLGWAGWISLQSKGLSRVFSNTTVQKHLLSVYLSEWMNLRGKWDCGEGNTGSWGETSYHKMWDPSWVPVGRIGKT